MTAASFGWWIACNTALAVAGAGLLHVAWRSSPRPGAWHIFGLALLERFVVPPLVAIPIVPPLALWGVSADRAPIAPVGSEALVRPEEAFVAAPLPAVPIAAVAIWLAGSAALGLLALARGRRFLRWVDAAEDRRHSRALSPHVARLASRVRIRPPRVRVVSGDIGPLVLRGAGGAHLVVSRRTLARLDPEARDAVLLHELAHLARRDDWWPPLAFAVAALSWWHPLVWLLRRQLGRLEERAADALALAAFGAAARRYARALVDAAAAGASATDRIVPVAAAPAVGEAASLARRLEMILAHRDCTRRPASLPPARSLAVRVLAVAAVAILVVAIPTLAQREPGPPQAPPAPPLDGAAPAPAPAPAPAAPTAPEAPAASEAPRKDRQTADDDSRDLVASVRAALERLRRERDALRAERGRIAREREELRRALERLHRDLERLRLRDRDDVHDSGGAEHSWGTAARPRDTIR